MRRSESAALAINTALPYIFQVRTAIETDVFQRYAASIWDDGEREQFIAWIAANPQAGEVIPGCARCAGPAQGWVSAAALG